MSIGSSTSLNNHLRNKVGSLVGGSWHSSLQVCIGQPHCLCKHMGMVGQLHKLQPAPKKLQNQPASNSHLESFFVIQQYIHQYIYIYKYMYIYIQMSDVLQLGGSLGLFFTSTSLEQQSSSDPHTTDQRLHCIWIWLHFVIIRTLKLRRSCKGKLRCLAIGILLDTELPAFQGDILLASVRPNLGKENGFSAVGVALYMCQLVCHGQITSNHTISMGISMCLWLPMSIVGQRHKPTNLRPTCLTQVSFKYTHALSVGVQPKLARVW